MSVWYCIPSKRPPEQVEPVLKAWRERGYKVALYVDESDKRFGLDAKQGLIVVAGTYPGYAAAVNRLVLLLLQGDARAEWFVTGGDDTYPDPNHSAEEIARECSEHFNHGHGPDFPMTYEQMRTWGVMQPTGDDYGDSRGKYVERVASSPWMGREFCRRINQGNGPLWPEYFHMGEDEELQAVATKLGIFWQRPDLKHYHAHWARPRAMREDMPEFLVRANSPEEWKKYKQIFERRLASGFPGHEPID